MIKKGKTALSQRWKKREKIEEWNVLLRLNDFRIVNYLIYKDISLFCVREPTASERDGGRVEWSFSEWERPMQYAERFGGFLMLEERISQVSEYLYLRNGGENATSLDLHQSE